MSRRVVIVGAGVLGAATACFLARDHGCEVTLLERDTGFARASSSLSASSIRQQFSTAVNIELSRWSLDFLRRVPQELAVGDQRPALGLVEPGSVERAAGDPQIRFRVTDMANAVPVVYAGLLPDLFREGQGVVANGKLGPDGVFRAAEILARHDETYMPPEVAEALKRSGHWQHMGQGDKKPAP